MFLRKHKFDDGEMITIGANIDEADDVAELMDMLFGDDDFECDDCETSCDECDFNSEFEAALDGVIDALMKAIDAYDKTSKKKVELKKCPVCGSSVHTYCNDDGYWYLSCNYCPLETKAAFETEEEAMDYWNDRD